MTEPTVPPVPTEQELEQLERTHVQNVYEAIAPHFSATRYKAWPVVEEFLHAQPRGSFGVDVGCGNGKYLCVNGGVATLGVEMSAGLAAIAQSKAQSKADVVVGDNLALPLRAAAFDFALSIAVVHHFASFDRRVRAVAEVARVLRRGGALLVFVWAQEQEDASKRRFEAQDVFVPWNLDKKAGNENIVYQRYYHVFVKGELDKVVEAAGGLEITKSGYDRDNWYVIARKL
ncbi:S-adenosyl-L-methionine-dependent methyltransferase [Obelidium mucronatum]|nr:S-adenosyl-L-methionine-dependent methyltransferase [Obelidium mucronatum]